MAPVSRAEFLRGKKGDLTGAVLRFLKDHKDQAFSFSEIISHLAIESGESFVLDTVWAMGISESLDELVGLQRVESRQVNGVMHYMAKQP